MHDTTHTHCCVEGCGKVSKRKHDNNQHVCKPRQVDLNLEDVSGELSDTQPTAPKQQRTGIATSSLHDASFLNGMPPEGANSADFKHLKQTSFEAAGSPEGAAVRLPPHAEQGTDEPQFSARAAGNQAMDNKTDRQGLLSEPRSRQSVGAFLGAAQRSADFLRHDSEAISLETSTTGGESVDRSAQASAATQMNLHVQPPDSVHEGNRLQDSTPAAPADPKPITPQSSTAASLHSSPFAIQTRAMRMWKAMSKSKSDHLFCGADVLIQEQSMRHSELASAILNAPSADAAADDLLSSGFTHDADGDDGTLEQQPPSSWRSGILSGSSAGPAADHDAGTTASGQDSAFRLQAHSCPATLSTPELNCPAFSVDTKFRGLHQLFPTNPLAMAARHLLIDALATSSPASVAGPQRPGAIHSAMTLLSTTIAEKQQQLPIAGESLLVFFPEETVQYALAFAVSTDHPGLDSLPEAKRMLLKDGQHIPIMWCLNAGDDFRQPHVGIKPSLVKYLRSDFSGRSSTVEATVTSAAHDSCPVPDSDVKSDCGTARTDTSPHVLCEQKLDIISVSNIVAAGNLAVPDAEQTCHFKHPVYRNTCIPTSIEEVAKRSHVAYVNEVLTADMHVQQACTAESAGAEAAAAGADETSPQLEDTGSEAMSSGQEGVQQNDSDDIRRQMVWQEISNPEIEFQLLDAEQSEMVQGWVTFLAERLAADFTHLPNESNPSTNVTIVSKKYNISRAAGTSYDFPVAREIDPTGNCSASDHATKCNWRKRSARSRTHVMSGKFGVIPITLQAYRCSVHKGSIEVGTRSFLDAFHQLYPGVRNGQMTVPFLPITGKIRMDEGAARHLWQLYCANYKSGIANIARMFHRFLFDRLQDELLGPDALNFMKQLVDSAQTENMWVNDALKLHIRKTAMDKVAARCTALVAEACSEAIVDSAIFQLHHCIISIEMPQYWAVMARFAPALGVDFTFKTAAKFTAAAQAATGKTQSYHVHASLSTVVGQYGFLVAAHTGGGHESASRMFSTVVDVFRCRQALSRELGTGAVPAAAVAVDNPSTAQRTIELAAQSVWPTQVASLGQVAVHMDHWHFVSRVREMVTHVRLPDASIFRRCWTNFVTWMLSPCIAMRAEYSPEAAALRTGALHSQILLCAETAFMCDRVQQLMRSTGCSLHAALLGVDCVLPDCLTSSSTAQQELQNGHVDGCSDSGYGDMSTAASHKQVDEDGAQRQQCCEHLKLAGDMCMLQVAVAQWLCWGTIRANAAVAARRCLKLRGWGLVAPLCGDVLPATAGWPWSPLAMFFNGERFQIPVSVIFAVDRHLRLSASTQDVPSPQTAQQPGTSDVNYGRNSQDLNLGAPGADRLDETGVSAFGDQSLAEVALTTTGPSTLPLAQAEGGAIVKLFCCTLRQTNTGALDEMIAGCAQGPTQSAQVPVSNPDLLGLNLRDRAADSLCMPESIVHLRRSGEEADTTSSASEQRKLLDLQDKNLSANTAPKSIMREPGIFKAALTSLRNTKAMNGLLEQQKFPIHFGGTNHAEAAHSRLSESLGPGARLGVDKAHQRLELHALHHNRKKAMALCADENFHRRTVNQRSDLLEARELCVNAVVAAERSQHPLCTGPIFAALMKTNTVSPRSFEELELAGYKLCPVERTEMTAELESKISDLLKQAVDDEKEGCSKYSLKTLFRRIKSEVDEPNLTQRQVQDVLQQKMHDWSD